MKEFCVVTNSNAAPFFSDMDMTFIRAESPEDAANKARRDYKHPAGLYALAVYQSSDAYHKGQKSLTRWLSKRADIRMNGVKCPHCGGKTALSEANTGRNGIIDIHVCKKCKRKVKVDMLTGVTMGSRV